MSVYMTEAEQIAIFKNWWKRYQNMITFSLAAVLLVFSGFKYWNYYAAKNMQEASVTYEQMMIALSQKNQVGIQSYANKLINDHANTVYADTARLTLAKEYVKSEQYEPSIVMLKQVADHSHVVPLAEVARLRIARILLEQKKYSAALEQLNKVSSLYYSAVRDQIFGDVYFAMGKKQQAISYYEQALKAFKANGITNVFLEMTMNDYE